MELTHQIQAYVPQNEQEMLDKQQMLQYLLQHPECVFRTDSIAHFTASIWTVNRQKTKALMVYHNIYDSWSWIGGHADGDTDLAAVAMKELREETGIQNAELVSPAVFSLETLTVSGHEKRGEYVSSHLHFNLTYLAVADESEIVKVKPDENKAVQWMSFDEVLQESTEPWMVERIYRKLIERCSK